MLVSANLVEVLPPLVTVDAVLMNVALLITCLPVSGA